MHETDGNTTRRMVTRILHTQSYMTADEHGIYECSTYPAPLPRTAGRLCHRRYLPPLFPLPERDARFNLYRNSWNGATFKSREPLKLANSHSGPFIPCGRWACSESLRSKHVLPPPFTEERFPEAAGGNALPYPCVCRMRLRVAPVFLIAAVLCGAHNFSTP